MVPGKGLQIKSGMPDLVTGVRRSMGNPTEKINTITQCTEGSQAEQTPVRHKATNITSGQIKNPTFLTAKTFHPNLNKYG